MIPAEGGAVANFAVDLPAVAKVTSTLTDAATDMDAAGSTFPDSVDGGDMTGLISDILATFSNAGARLVDETGTLAALADQAAADYGSADGAAAERMLLPGGGS